MGTHNPANDKYIAEVAEVTSPTGNELVPISDSGIPKNIKISNIDTDTFLNLTDVSLTSFTEGRIPFEGATGLSDSSGLEYLSGVLTVSGAVVGDKLYCKHGGSESAPLFNVDSDGAGGAVGFYGSRSSGNEFLGVTIGGAQQVKFEPGKLTLNAYTVDEQVTSHPDPDPGFDSTAALANGDIEVKSNVDGTVVTSRSHLHVPKLSYAAPSSWLTGDSYKGASGVMFNRLAGVDNKGNVTVTGNQAYNNYNRVEYIFNGTYEDALRGAASTDLVLEIDFNPWLDWTANGADGLTYTAGVFALWFFGPNSTPRLAQTILIEGYCRVGGVDQWVTFRNVSNDKNPYVTEFGDELSAYTYTKKIKITLSSPAHVSNEIWVTQAEWYPFRSDANDGAPVSMPTTPSRDVELTGKKFAWMRPSDQVERFAIDASGASPVTIDVPVYADNAAAIAGGLAVGMLYRTTIGQLMVRY